MTAWAVYFIKPVHYAGPVKIGRTQNVQTRFRDLQMVSPLLLEVAATITGDLDLEFRFHSAFAHLRSHGEWFHASPDLQRTIAMVRSGTFDVASLPPAKRLGIGGPDYGSRKQAGRDAAPFSRRLSELSAAGIDLPPEVRRAGFTFGLPDDEVERRRRLVREFIFEMEPWRRDSSRKGPPAPASAGSENDDG